MIRRIEDIEAKLQKNKDEMSKLVNSTDMKLYSYADRRNHMSSIKDLMFLLRETADLISEYELEMCRPIINTSDMMPCQMCNDHWPVPDEHVRGIRWEPVAGKGWVYICWECAVGLYKTLSGQMERLSYSFLFSLNKEVGTQRGKLLKEIEETK